MPRSWIALVGALAVSLTAIGQDGASDSSERVHVSVVPAASVVAPGADLPVAIVLEIDPGWHIWTNTREIPEGIATFDSAELTTITAPAAGGPLRPASADSSEWIVTASGATGSTEVFAQWPQFHTVKADVGDGMQSYAVFEGRTVVFVPVSIAANAPEGSQTLALSVAFQACDATTCLRPAALKLNLTIDVKKGAASGALPEALRGFDPGIFAHIHGGTAPAQAVVFDFFGFDFSIEPSGSGFVLLLLVAAMGGLLLNFTPCVLPVIPLKIMGLAHSAGNRRRCAQLGAALSLGVIGFWVALGGAVTLVTGFTSSQLFQYPWFTVGVGLVIAVMAVGMCGFFAVQLPQRIAGIDFRHDTVAGSVGFGVMTAVLSTPCTAPLMGAAAAWAATQSSTTVLAVFATIGAGMALPYFVLSAFPQLVARVPRSGPASDLVKQTMGLLLLAAAIYFIGSGLSGWLTEPPQPPSRLYWWAVGAFGVAAGGWLAVRSFQIAKTSKGKLAFGAVGAFVLAVSAAVGVRLSDDGRIDWVYYTPERLAEALADGDAVLIDFTAEWCLNCKTLESTVLERDAIVDRLEAGGITPIKVDLTGNNEPGRELLKKFDRITIPLLVILDPSGKEVFKSDAYTPGQVMKALDAAAPPHAAKPAP